MSVGKTTLVNALKQLDQFKDYNFATERSEYLMNLGIPLNTDSTLKGQTVFLAERCAELMRDNIITDRTILDVIAFTNSAKSIDYKDKEIFEQYAVEFLREYYRDIIDFSITTLIKRYGHRINNIEVIKGSTEERIEQILKFIGS